MKYTITILLCIKSFFVFGQDFNRKNDFTSKLLALCMEITKDNPQQDNVSTQIYSLDNTLIGTEEQVNKQYDNGFYLDRRYSYVPSSNKPNEPDNTIITNIYKKTNQNYYYITIQLRSTYTIDKGNNIVYKETDNITTYKTSYPTLSEVFGNPVAYPIQPKETKNYLYQYHNPISGKTALIKVVSWDCPLVTYNTIYSITICNKELDTDIDNLLKIKKKKLNKRLKSKAQ